jgi:hypothetical protein
MIRVRKGGDTVAKSSAPARPLRRGGVVAMRGAIGIAATATVLGMDLNVNAAI